MRKSRIIILSSLLAMIVFVIVGIQFAWMTNAKMIEGEIEGGNVVGAYFGGGDGTEEIPFIISNKIHLYNLAWLQYLGQFNTTTTTVVDETTIEVYHQRYFKMTNNVDMINLPLPAIGTETIPFIGNFDGGGYTIHNLTVSNDVETLHTKPEKVREEGFDGGEIVGFFGVIGSYGVEEMAEYDEDIIRARDVYLNNIQVESISSKTLIGLVAGYANGNLSNIGVHQSSIQLKIERVSPILETIGKVSCYGLVGYYTGNVSSGIGGSGPGMSFGTTLDIKAIYDRMSRINGISGQSIVSALTTESVEIELTNKVSTSQGYSSEKSGDFTAATSGYVVNQNAYIPVLAASMNETTGKEVPSPLNTGYYIGNVQRDTGVEIVSFTRPPITDQNFYQYKDSSHSTRVTDNVSDKVKNATIFSTEEKFYGIQLQNQVDQNRYISIPDAVIGEYTSTSAKPALVPEACVWFAPQEVGKLEFAVYSPAKGSTFAVFEMTRSVAKDYSSRFSTNFTMYKELQSDTWYYYSYDITQEQIDAGKEFALGQQEPGTAPYLCYVDLGMSGSTGDEPSYSIEDVDFVYQTEGEFNEILEGNLSSLVFIIADTDQMVALYMKRESLDEFKYAIIPNRDTSITHENNGSIITNIIAYSDASLTSPL